MKLAPHLTALTKINSKCIKDSHVIPQSIELLEENIRKNVLDVGLGNDFLGYDT